MPYRIYNIEKPDYPEVVEVWEASVRATHHFLKKEDIQAFKPLILQHYLDAVNLKGVRNEIINMKLIIAFLITVLLFFIPKSEEFKFRITNFAQEGISDYLPIKYKKGIIYASLRDSTSTTFYGIKLYHANIFKKEKLSVPIKVRNEQEREFIQPIPGCYHEATNEFYFSMRSKETNSKNRLNLAIYRAGIRNFRLTDIECLNFNNPEYGFAFPTLSSDGNSMIISSNMHGEFSLYEYKRAGFGETWTLNRKLDELDNGYQGVYPNLVNDSTLVFASNDEMGMGGLDLYQSKKIGDLWDFPENMKALNSEKDEFGILMIDSISGYLSSNREGENFHIYYFEKRE